MSGDRRVIEATPGSPLQASAPNAHPAQGAVMIRNSIFISLDSFFAGGRVGPVVLHRNWREQVVLTGGTNAPRAVHADRQSSMVVPPVPPFGTTKSLRIGCSTTGTPVPPGITAVLSWDAKACSENPRASASAALNTFKGAVRASFRKPAPRAADVCPAMKLVGKPNAGNRPVLAGLPAHPSTTLRPGDRVPRG